MSVRRAGRRPGRPLLGRQPLDERLTVMVTREMLSRIEARAGGHVAEFVRAALGRALSGTRIGKVRRGRGRGTGRARRFGK